MDKTETPKKKGRPPVVERKGRATITLPAHLIEWAKDEPEGLSGLCADYLKKLKAQRGRKAKRGE
jgi:hypothetical protein